MSRSPLLLLAALLAGACASPPTAGRGGVASRPLRAPALDAAQVEAALAYLAAPSPERLQAVAATPAMEHLAEHARRTGTFPPETSRLELARAVVTEPGSGPEEVRRLLETIRSSPERRRECLAEALRHLPPDPGFRPRVFLTRGYDIGVATPGAASLNLAHPRFAERPGELWHYCIHEVHHAGVMRLHPLPDLRQVETTGELLELVRYLTFLEGTAVHAALDARRRRGELDDPDYRALGDEERMREILGRYREVYRRIENRAGRAATPEDWALIEPLSDGERLWYRAGARMAADIEAACGGEALLEVIRRGPDAFFARAEAAAAGEGCMNRRPES